MSYKTCETRKKKASGEETRRMAFCKCCLFNTRMTYYTCTYIYVLCNTACTDLLYIIIHRWSRDIEDDIPTRHRVKVGRYRCRLHFGFATRSRVRFKSYHLLRPKPLA